MPVRATHFGLASVLVAALLVAGPAAAEQAKGKARPPDGSSRIIQKGSDPIDEKGVQPKAGAAVPGITSPRDPASGQATGRR
jgi:hypothetical protein